MQRLEFVRSRAKNALRLLMALLLGGICLLTALDPGENFINRTVGWFGTVFFGGLASLVGMRNIVRGGTVFAFDSGGVTDASNGIVIRWHELEACVAVSVRGTMFLGLILRDRDQFLRRLSLRKRMMARLDERAGCGQWALSFSDVSPGIDAALDFVRQHAPSVRAPAA